MKPLPPETPMRVLVTAAGAGPGVALIKALRRMRSPGAMVLGVDTQDQAAGLYLADGWAIVPSAADPTAYRGRLLALCREHSIHMVIPILDVEAVALAHSQPAFASEGIYLAINPADAIFATTDKRQSYEHCCGVICQPEQFAAPCDASPADYPLIGKRRKGTGARDVHLLPSPGGALPQVPADNYLWQQFIEGNEFSIDTFGDPDSDLFVAVPRWRRLVRAGQMVQGPTVADEALETFARQICRHFGCCEVCCVQVIRASDGRLFFIELNPRYGTGVSLSIAAGVCFPRLQWLRAFAPQCLAAEWPRFEPNLTMLRYWEEVYLDADGKPRQSVREGAQ